MKKLGLRAEHLGELTTEELRLIAGAAGQRRATVSDGSCVCWAGVDIVWPACDVSDGSCVCTRTA